MDHYSRRNLEELVVPNYNDSSDSYPSSDLWSGSWNMNSSSSEAVEKCFDYDVINNGFSGGLYSEMELGTSEEVKEESKRSKTNGCFFSSLDDFDGIQQMDDMFLSSILEDAPGNSNLQSFDESVSNTPGSFSTAHLDIVACRQQPMFHNNWEACQNMPIMEEDASMNLREENMDDEVSTEEIVLQDLQKATEKMTDDTRKCFRDTFYRLAKNSRLKSESSNSNSEKFLEDETRKQETELETNSIDRAVANLTFNKMESNMRNLPPPKRVSSFQR